MKTKNSAHNSSNVEAHNRKFVKDLCRPFVLDDDTLRIIKDVFHNEMKLGLDESTNATAVIKCWVTYIQSLPTGYENGRFLALDLGGTHFRVLCIHLHGELDFKIDSVIYDIPDHIRKGPGKGLFDLIARSLAKFIKCVGIEAHEKVPLGFTFSFPVRQHGIDKGELVAWTKGFQCYDVIGKDVVELLRESMRAHNVNNVDLTALLNDTTGTLISCAWRNRYCKIGLIVGTGTNSCYLERLKDITTVDMGPNNKVPTMIINCESGAFGDNGTLEFIRTNFDKEVDRESPNHSFQLFEKMVSGMYLGELARKLIVECCKAGALFKGRLSEQMREKNSFKTEFISRIEQENSVKYLLAREVLKKMGYEDVTVADCGNVRYICECISRRSAHLLSTNIACLIDQIGDPYVVVGIDGSVYRYHPHYHNLLKQKVKVLARPEYRFDLMLSEDGSGRGAAIAAAIAAKAKKLKIPQVRNYHHLTLVSKICKGLLKLK